MYVMLCFLKMIRQIEKLIEQILIKIVISRTRRFKELFRNWTKKMYYKFKKK